MVSPVTIKEAVTTCMSSCKDFTLWLLNSDVDYF